MTSPDSADRAPTGSDSTVPDVVERPGPEHAASDLAGATAGDTAGETAADTAADTAGDTAGDTGHPARPRTASRGPRQSQSMKPSTAAAKLGVHLPATPEEFRAGPVTREELDALQRTPPPWLVELRRTGPHPRSVVAARLRVSTSGLARAGLTEPLTTAEIDALIAEAPEWLHRERASLAEVKREEARLRERAARRRSGPGAP